LAETAQGFEMTPVVADVAVEGSLDALFVEPFDVVVANAGTGHNSKVKDTSLADWNRVITVNLTGVFLTFRAALQTMQPGGRLIAIASTASLQGGSNIAAYSASKHGVLGLVRSTAKEVARQNITCNAVCPGFVDTDMATAAIEGVSDKFGVDAAKAEAMIVAGNPMKRLITVDEVSAAVLFLASDGASSINGHALSVSGGEI
jgi:NAD(P)-dependent dehydrogenase (short-subunit alcohol dehydrogenase family)